MSEPLWSKVTIVALVSGGVDSTTAALHALHRYCFEPRGLGAEVDCEAYALTVVYGQRHGREVEAARRFAERYGFKHLTVEVPVLSASRLGLPGGSALTGEVEVPEEAEPGRVPETYVPQRNLVLLSVAFAAAEMLLSKRGGVGVVSVGFHAEDNVPGEPVYPDTRPEFASAVHAAASLGSGVVYEGRGRLILHAPWAVWPKWMIIAWGVKHGMDYSLTWTCYRGGSRACGRCPACLQRLRSFMAAGYPDPIEYEQLPRWYEEWLEARRRCEAGEEEYCSRAEELSRLARLGRLPR